MLITRTITFYCGRQRISEHHAAELQVHECVTSAPNMFEHIPCQSFGGGFHALPHVTVSKPWLMQRALAAGMRYMAAHAAQRDNVLQWMGPVLKVCKSLGGFDLFGTMLVWQHS